VRERAAATSRAGDGASERTGRRAGYAAQQSSPCDGRARKIAHAPSQRARRAGSRNREGAARRSRRRSVAASSRSRCSRSITHLLRREENGLRCASGQSSANSSSRSS
jgi:hypothetical protein